MTTPEQQLSEFRRRIDALDETIAQALLERCSIVRQVAALKAAHWPADCHIRSGREGKMHRAIVERFTGTDISPIVALAIWRQFIGAATQMESPLTIATLATEPHHFWLAREYFGVGAHIERCEDLASLTRALDLEYCNLALLPEPVGNHWPEAAALHAHGLSLFAKLPVTTQSLPVGAALAFARITPEPSGDDLSYFLHDGQLLIVDGFEQAREHAVFLGAHPRSILL